MIRKDEKMIRKQEKVDNLLRKIKDINFHTLFYNLFDRTEKCVYNIIGYITKSTYETAAIDEYKNLCKKLHDVINQYLIDYNKINEAGQIIDEKSKSLPFLKNIMSSCDKAQSLDRLKDILSQEPLLVNEIHALTKKHFPSTSVLSDTGVKNFFQTMCKKLSHMNEIIITDLKKTQSSWKYWEEQRQQDPQSTQYYLNPSETLNKVKSNFKFFCPTTTKTYDQLYPLRSKLIAR